LNVVEQSLFTLPTVVQQQFIGEVDKFITAVSSFFVQNYQNWLMFYGVVQKVKMGQYVRHTV